MRPRSLTISPRFRRSVSKKIRAEHSVPAANTTVSPSMLDGFTGRQPRRHDGLGAILRIEQQVVDEQPRVIFKSFLRLALP